MCQSGNSGTVRNVADVNAVNSEFSAVIAGCGPGVTEGSILISRSRYIPQIIVDLIGIGQLCWKMLKNPHH